LAGFSKYLYPPIRILLTFSLIWKLQDSQTE
jgi:hypothetical protein